MRILLWQSGLAFKLADATSQSKILVAELAKLVVEVVDLAFKLINLFELPRNSMLKGKNSGRRGKRFFAQMLLNKRDDGLRAAEISVEDSLARKHGPTPPSKVEESSDDSTTSSKGLCRLPEVLILPILETT